MNFVTVQNVRVKLRTVAVYGTRTAAATSRPLHIGRKEQHWLCFVLCIKAKASALFVDLACDG
jgi:hypothetical protein